MQYQEAKTIQATLRAETSKYSEQIKQFPRGAMNLVPDHIKFSPEYRVVKNALDAAFSKERAFNAFVAKNFKKEEKDARNARRAQMVQA